MKGRGRGDKGSRDEASEMAASSIEVEWFVVPKIQSFKASILYNSKPRLPNSDLLQRNNCLQLHISIAHPNTPIMQPLYLCLLLFAGLSAAQFQFFEQMFGGQQGGHPHHGQQQQEKQNVASDSEWYQRTYDSCELLANLHSLSMTLERAELS